MLPLFTETEEWTNEADRLYSEAISKLSPMVAEWQSKGYGTREIAYVINSALINEELKYRALARSKRVKK